MTSENQQPHEESTMEDILSSIRQIISGDKDDTTIKKPEMLTASSEPDDEEEILDLINILKNDAHNMDLSAKKSASETGGVEMNDDDELELEAGNVIDPDSLPEGEIEGEADEMLDAAADDEDLSLESTVESLTEEISEPLEEEAEEVTASFDAPVVDAEETPLQNVNPSGEPYLSEVSISQAAEALDTLARLTEKTKQEIPVPQSIGGMTVDGLMREVLKPLLREWLEGNLPSIVRAIVTEEVQRIVRQQRGDSSKDRDVA